MTSKLRTDAPEVTERAKRQRTALRAALGEGGRYGGTAVSLDAESSRNLQRLCATYRDAKREATRLCLLTGGGVSYVSAGDYDTPGWKGLLEALHARLRDEKLLRDDETSYAMMRSRYPRDWDLAERFLEAAGKTRLQEAIRTAIQRWPGQDTAREYKRLPRKYLEHQLTLNATIAFCSRIRRVNVWPCYGPNLDRIAAVITLNYDWYLEGGATQKYETGSSRSLKPMTRCESTLYETCLPVYHIHGYLPYEADRTPRSDLILARSDYQRAYADESSFLRRTLDRLLDDSRMLLFGLSFEDEYLLDRLTAHAAGTAEPRHYALLSKSEFTAERLARIRDAGIATILYEEHDNVPHLLGEIYKCGLDEHALRELQSMISFEARLSAQDYWNLLLFNKK
jgi:hypothetical protein